MRKFLTVLKAKINTFFNLIKEKKTRPTIILICIISAFTFGVFLTAVLSAKSFPSYIYIETEEQLCNIKNNLNGDYIITKQNILITKPWTPIGDLEHPFTGTIQGRNSVITFSNVENSFKEDGDIQYFALFANNKGLIKELTINLEEFNLNGKSNKDAYFGLFAAFSSGSLSNLYARWATSSINISTNSNLYCGSMAAVSSNNLIKLRSTAHFNIESTGDVYFGQLSSNLEKNFRVEQCLAGGQLDVVQANNFVGGGICAEISSDGSGYIENSYSNIHTNKPINNSLDITFGGFIGLNKSEINIDIKNSMSAIVINNQKSGFYSGFIGNGSASFLNCLSSARFLSDSDTINFSHFDFSNDSIHNNCIYNVLYNNIYNKEDCLYQDYEKITVESMKWDDKVWRKDPDNGFGLIF